MASEDAVGVVVEARLVLEELRDLGLAARGAEVAPPVDDMYLGRLARGIALDHADGARMRPVGRLQRGERGGGTRVVREHALFAGAYAGAAPELMAEAAVAARGVDAERLQAKRMLVGESAQRLQRGAPRAEQAVDEGQGVGADLVHAGEVQPAAVEGEAAGGASLAQLTVELGRELLHQARLGEEGAELADRAPPVDAAHALQPGRTR